MSKPVGTSHDNLNINEIPAANSSSLRSASSHPLSGRAVQRGVSVSLDEGTLPHNIALRRMSSVRGDSQSPETSHGNFNPNAASPIRGRLHRSIRSNSHSPPSSSRFGQRRLSESLDKGTHLPNINLVRRQSSSPGASRSSVPSSDSSIVIKRTPNITVLTSNILGLPAGGIGRPKKCAVQCRLLPALNKNSGERFSLVTLMEDSTGAYQYPTDEEERITFQGEAISSLEDKARIITEITQAIYPIIHLNFQTMPGSPDANIVIPTKDNSKVLSSTDKLKVELVDIQGEAPGLAKPYKRCVVQYEILSVAHCPGTYVCVSVTLYNQFMSRSYTTWDQRYIFCGKRAVHKLSKKEKSELTSRIQTTTNRKICLLFPKNLPFPNIAFILNPPS